MDAIAIGRRVEAVEIVCSILQRYAVCAQVYTKRNEDRFFVLGHRTRAVDELDDLTMEYD